MQYNSAKVNDDLDVFLNFKRPEKELEFNNFSVKESPFFILGTYVLIETLYSITYVAAILPEHNAFLLFGALCRLASALFGIFYFIMLRKARINGNSNTGTPLSVTCVGNISIMVTTLAVAMNLIAITHHGKCELRQACNGDGDLRSGVIILVTFLVIIRPTVIRCRTPWIIMLSAAVQFALLVTCFVLLETPPQDVGPTILVIIFLPFCLYQYDFSMRCIFLFYSELQESSRLNVEMEHETRLIEHQTQEMKQFIGNVAHDLKSPLHAFGFELDTLLRASGRANTTESPPGDEECNVLVGKVVESVDMLKSICSFMLMTINRAIDYTKVTSGISLVPALETVDLHGAMTWVMQCSKRSKGACYIDVRPLPEDMCNFVITDKQWLLENLLCLVSNAVKFTPEGAVTIACSLVHTTEIKMDCNTARLEVTENTSKMSENKQNSDSLMLEMMSPTIISPGDQVILVEVVDCGIGISQDQQKLLFQPFKQAQQRAGGTGLGLYSLSKRVESLGGLCGVSDRLDGNQGSRFWFTLPYRPDHASALSDGANSSMRSMGASSDRRRKNSVDESNSSASSRKSSIYQHCENGDEPVDLATAALLAMEELKKQVKNILLVEDSLMIQKTTRRALRAAGYSVDVANNGLECLKTMQQRPCDLILMDLQMPIMDGLETTRRIRALEAAAYCSKFETMHEATPMVSQDIDVDIESQMRIPIIGVSANSDFQSERDALDAGMDAYMAKPLSVDMLEACIARLNGRRSGFD
jgi:signal transduction histidine kinase/DNA-binding NarL/FixJ family response regulator